MTNLDDDELLWFFHHLEEQVDDIRLERNGKKIVLLFDTHDIQSSIIGFPTFYDDAVRRFDKGLFASSRTLVRSLVSSGCFDRIQLLPPHQVELLHVLERTVPTTTKQWKDNLERFFRDFSKYLGKSKEVDLSDPEALSNQLLTDYAFADSWFKFLQNLDPWQARLSTLLRLKILHLDGEQKKWIPQVIGLPELEDLKNAFETDFNRSHLGVNNFTDALALVCLSRMISEFDKGKSEVAPRFFDADMSSVSRGSKRSTFQNAIREAKLESDFVFAKSGRSVFRNEDYFVFKVALRNPFSSTKSKNNDDAILSLYEELAPKIRDGRQLDAVSDIRFQDEPLAKLIESLQKYSFLRNDWLKTVAQKDLQVKLETIKRHFEGSDNVQDLFAFFEDFYRDEEKQNRVIAAISSTKNKLKVNVRKDFEMLMRLRKLWPLLEAAINSLPTRIHTDENGGFNTFRDLGLLRYGFPIERHKEIREILDGLVGGDEASIKNAKASFLQYYIEAHEKGDKNPTAVLITAAILVALRLNNEIIELMEKTEAKHFSLKTVFADSVFRSSTERRDSKKESLWNRGMRICDELISLSTSKEYNRLAKADLNVAIAYLSYHEWRLQVKDAEWRLTNPTASIRAIYDRHQSVINRAIDRARRAFELFKEDDPSKKLYALNQEIFYAVEGGDISRFEQIKNSVLEFVKYKENRALWQFRFDDTLARYYHRLSTSATSLEEKKKFSNYAISCSQDASAKSDDDPDVRNYLCTLQAYDASLT